MARSRDLEGKLREIVAKQKEKAGRDAALAKENEKLTQDIHDLTQAHQKSLADYQALEADKIVFLSMLPIESPRGYKRSR